LLTLRLESNSFTGFDYSPNPPSVSFKDFNVSNNNLTGEVPLFLTKFGLPSFLGNEQLCGKPLPHIYPHPTAVNPPTPKGKHHGSNHAVLISVSVAIGFLVIAGAVKRWRRRTKRSEVGGGTPPKAGNGYDYVRRHYGTKTLKSVGANCNSYGPRVPNESVGGPQDMVVLEGCNPGVGKVGDLLKASAEMLGMGSVGATYKIMIDGRDDVVVVKRVRERRVHGKEVDGLLRLIGELRHSNIVSLRAYHNSNHELLLVYDFLPNGSLNSLLHGNRGPGRITPLDWSTRLKLASGSAQALAFLHAFCHKAQVFHGHVTSSNILIDHMGNACLADIGLQQLLAGPSPSYNPYKAPELIMPSSFSPNKYTCKCDVYSFGVVLMEILTGRMAGEEGEMGLVEWVNAAVKEECNTWEVFDFELLSDKEMAEEMWALFQVGLLCLAALPKDRPTMNMVHNMIEDIRKKGVREGGMSKSILDDISYDSSSSS
jgi:hypothetical protein